MQLYLSIRSVRHTTRSTVLRTNQGNSFRMNEWSMHFSCLTLTETTAVPEYKGHQTTTHGLRYNGHLASSRVCLTSLISPIVRCPLSIVHRMNNCLCYQNQTKPRGLVPLKLWREQADPNPNPRWEDVQHTIPTRAVGALHFHDRSYSDHHHSCPQSSRDDTFLVKHRPKWRQEKKKKTPHPETISGGV